MDEIRLGRRDDGGILIWDHATGMGTIFLAKGPLEEEVDQKVRAEDADGDEDGE